MRPFGLALLSAVTLCGGVRAQEPSAMSLDDAIAYALAHQPDVAAAAASRRGAEGAAQSARAGSLPTVQASASDSRAQDEPPGFQRASTTVTARQLIFDLGRTPHTIASARAQLGAARASESDTRLFVARTVTDAYYALLKAEGVAAAGAETLKSRQAERDAAQARLDNGSAARFDVLRADTALAQSRQALVAADAEVRHARAALNTAIGRSANEPITPVEPADLDAPGEADPVAFALANRPDVMAARLQVDAARHSLSATKVGNAPTLSAGGDLNGQRRTFPADTLRWSAGVTLSWTAFDGFRNAGEVRSARASVQLAEARLRTVELNASQQVTDGVIAVETAAEQVRLGEATFQQAKEARDVAVGRYQAGAGSQLEVSDAESQLHTATVDLVNARYSLGQARRVLWYITGKTPH